MIPKGFHIEAVNTVIIDGEPVSKWVVVERTGNNPSDWKRGAVVFDDKSEAQAAADDGDLGDAP